MSNRIARITLVGIALAAAGSAERAAAQSSGKTQFHPNRQKYSDAGAKPAKGRSGSAALESRALLGKDGVALVEATTGSLDDGTAPGQIRKMQVKFLSKTGAPGFTQNYNGLSGTGLWSHSYPGLGRNQTIQLQANIGGIDRNRNDVVTVTTQVKRRPDVALDAVTAPERALAGTRVNIVATVSEKNGDMGGRATCVLAVDGRVLDQAAGIWVDAGHTVSCAFQTSFTTLGVRQVQVYATGMSPVDWDMTNNSASTAVEVVSPETPMNYSAKFTATDFTYDSFDKYTNSDGSYLDEKTESGTRQTRALTMSSWTSANTFTFPVRVRSALSSAGTAAFDVTNDIAFNADASGPGGDCGNLFQAGVTITVCNYRYGSVLKSQVDLTSSGGRVTYFGTQNYQAYGWDGYATNTSMDSPIGVGEYAVGSDVSPVVELSDARGVMFATRPRIALTSTPINTNFSGCNYNEYNDVTYCSSFKSVGTSKKGLGGDTSH
jgi:hypothetical protein